MNPHPRLGAAASITLVGIPMLMLVFGLAKLSAPRERHMDVNRVVAESGGWTPANFTVGADEQAQIHVTSKNERPGPT